MPEELKKYLFAFSFLPIFGSVIALTNFTTLPTTRAVLYGVICQIGVFLLGFGKKIWDKLEPLLVDAGAKYANNLVGDWISGPLFLRRYKEYVLNSYDLFNVKGLGSINAIKFEHIFVELSIDESFANDNASVLLGAYGKTDQLEGNHPIWEYIKKLRTKNFDGIAYSILGAPGSGKTSLLQNISITFASDKADAHNLPRYVPITLFLREHIDAMNDDTDLARLLQEYFGNERKFSDLKPPENWFNNNLKCGRGLILLDGLDEVADVDKRKKVSEWIDRQIGKYPKSRFLITARPQGYQSAPLQRATVLKIKAFSIAQLRKFINNWYSIHEKHEPTATKKADNLIEILQNSPSLKAISVNPLLLTMIAIVHQFHGALPGSRSDLYKELCRALLQDWQKEKVEVKWDKDQKLKILRPLAGHMMEINKAQIPYRDVRQIVAAPLGSIGVGEDRIDEFLDELELRSGLFVEKAAERIGREEWGFVHLSFQEFLTAEHWMENKEKEQEWSQLIEVSWWHEALRFYAAMDEAKPIIDACKKIDSRESLALMLAIDMDDDQIKQQNKGRFRERGII